MTRERDWTGELVVVIGAARQGVALTRYLLDHGARVRLTDVRPFSELNTARESLKVYSGSKSLEWVTDGHPVELLKGATLVCPSGGVPLTTPIVEEARRRSIPLSNDSQIFLETTPCVVIGITGSAGKTTTTRLVGSIAQQALKIPGFSRYQKIWVGGNIGNPLISSLDQIGPDDLAVMELSSFQLEIMKSSPHIASILNITPNHLDRHETMAAYTRAKSVILGFQGDQDIAVLGRDDPTAWALAKNARGKIYSFGLTPLAEDQMGSYLFDDTIQIRREMVKSKSRDLEIININDIKLRGTHNLLNVLAACAISEAAELPPEAMKTGVGGFTGLPHRLEFVRKWNGAGWYNDSIATAPERAMAAVRSFHEPLILLAGGRDKNLPWDEFSYLAQKRVEHLILFGEAAEKIYQSIKKVPGDLHVVRCSNLQDAVLKAAELVKPGYVVLLSPGGTSFDEFKDFEERGECFVRMVQELP